MARTFRTYEYVPQNREKYRGDTIPIIFRSSWELEFAQHCDLLPTVLGWSYETIEVPYRDPITGKQKIYIPDFMVEIIQEGGFSVNYVFEIKPMHEQYQEHARTQHDSALVARNAAKWMAATQWADRHSAIFEVLNESDLYSWHGARKPRTQIVKTFAPTTTKAKTAPRPKVPNKRVAVPTAKSAVSTMQARIKRARVARTTTVKKARKI